MLCYASCAHGMRMQSIAYSMQIVQLSAESTDMNVERSIPPRPPRYGEPCVVEAMRLSLASLRPMVRLRGKGKLSPCESASGTSLCNACARSSVVDGSASRRRARRRRE